MVSTSVFSQIGVADLQDKRNLSNILKEGYVQTKNDTYRKSNGDIIVFGGGENIWYGNDKKTFDNLKSTINSSYQLISRGFRDGHQYEHYRKGGISYIFSTYNYGSRFRYVVNVAKSFGNCDM